MQREALFGPWLKQRRAKLGLTQDDLARLINCSTATIRKLETGSRRPSREIAVLLAKHLDVAPHEYSAFVGFARGDHATPACDDQAAPAPGRSAPVSWNAAQRSLNLPLPLTPFIGRSHEVALLQQRITQSQTRLMTLTGPAGVGKTRLALEVGAKASDTFADGVFFVALELVTDPALVAHGIVRALRLVEDVKGPPSTQLLAYFHDKHALLILDTFEHVVTAASVIAELLPACPWLQVLVTSRLPLQLRAEQHYAVRPLPLPDPDQSILFEQLSEYSGVALFVNRAQAAKSDWMLTPENAPAVIDLCRHLDGLPLAIELAAAHSSWLSPQHMLHQLRTNYPILLSKGFRDSSARQQTLRDAIDWSYNLLDPPTQYLFVRLAVFRGGWTLQAVAAVDAHAPIAADSAAASARYLRLANLVDHNLIRREETGSGEVRFTMLHTMREYAREKLDACGEMLMMQKRHARYFRDLAEALEPLLRGDQQLATLQVIEQEYANFQAALGWYQSVPNGVEDGLRLAGALGEFWFIRSNVVQGHSWLHAFLEGDGQVALAVRAKALRYAAVLASPQGNVALALRWNEESLAVHRALHDDWGAAYTLAALADVQLCHNHNPDQGRDLYVQSLNLARMINDPWLLARVTWRMGMENYYSGRDVMEGQRLLEESLAAATTISDLWGMSNALPHVANTARSQGDTVRATVLLEQGLTLARTIGNQRSIATTLNIMGLLALEAGMYDQAKAYLEESLAVAKSAHLSFQQGTALYLLGQGALHQGTYAEAYTWLVQSFQQHHALNAKSKIVLCLILLADVAFHTQHLERVVQLLGTAAHLLDTLDVHLTGADLRAYESLIAATQSQLDHPTWRRAWAAGQNVSLDQVLVDVYRWQL